MGKGHLRQRSEGSWTLVYSLPPDPVTGKRRQKSETIHGSKRDAQRILTQRLAAIERGEWFEATKLTLAELCDKWLETATGGLTQSSRNAYEDIIKHHLKPHLGAVRLTQLSPAHAEAFYARQQREGRLDGKGGLSARTILGQHRVLRLVLRAAVRWRLLPRDPLAEVVPPRVPRQSPGQGLPVADAARLLVALETDAPSFYVPALLALCGGLRAGEVCGVRWEDLNLKTGLLLVARQLSRVRRGEEWSLEVSLPKDGEARWVRLPAFAAMALARHQERQPAGAVYVASADGGARCPRLLSSQWGKFLRSREDLPRVRFHDLRHSAASIALHLGSPVSVVSEMLGHSDPGITLQVYSHVLSGAHEAAAARLDAAFQAAFANGFAHEERGERENDLRQDGS